MLKRKIRTANRRKSGIASTGCGVGPASGVSACMFAFPLLLPRSAGSSAF